MREIAPEVYLLGGFPPNVVNAYLVGNMLVDAGTRYDYRRILRQIRGRQVVAHVVTHVHPDHQGASQAICTTLGIPLWCGTADIPAMENGDLRPHYPNPDHWLVRLINHTWSGPPYPVTRHLTEGDVLGDFLVLDAPGHTPGHIALWRERDRVLILGDVLVGMNMLTGLPGVGEPPSIFTVDPARNRASIRKLAALRPEIVCFGHGPPLTDGAKAAEFVARLAE